MCISSSNREFPALQPPWLPRPCHCGSSTFGLIHFGHLPSVFSTRRPSAPCGMTSSTNRAVVILAIALVAVGAHGQSPDAAREFHVTFPLQDHVGNVLTPSLLEGLNLFTSDIAKHIQEHRRGG
ncbi:unnamed protein product [Prorocentrum cordatum]|uniref:Subtilisin n=1 Tax=Prorocentrum cordatum TaxID=2364126 RepID=A0ABN9YB16_9DINO|nr:unnamed protein product [Polarella glacialis]